MTSWWRARGVPDEEVRARVARVLDELTQTPTGRRPDALLGLIDVLRPRWRGDATAARRNVDALTALVVADEPRRRALRETLIEVLADKQWIHLLADAGVLSGESFFAGLGRRIGQSVLPGVYNADSLRDYLGRLFPRPRDHEWVDSVPDEVWATLLDALELSDLPEEVRARIAHQVLESVQVLSYRIAAIGLEPELVRNYPAIERYESPFLAQSEEVRQLLRERQAALAENRAPATDEKHLLVLLDQCVEIVSKVRRLAEKTGASISLTALILRLYESIDRVRVLIDLLEPRPAAESTLARVHLFKELVRAQNTDNALSHHWARHVELLALRVTGNAGKTGEHYITQSRAEYRDMLRSAAGAGFVIAFMALIKVALSATPNAPFVEAAQYSLNYGLGFVLIYMLHFTIATKQPAMTASHIAASLDNASGRADRLDGLAELVVRTHRSQFIAVVGNVGMVLPLSVLLAAAVFAQTGTHVVTPDEASQVLHDLSPVHSLALFHAAIAGVCLFLAGLLSGYYDNRAVYNQLRVRIAQRPALRRWLGAERTERLAQYIEDHLGGIAGTFLFGAMLGSVGTIGFVLGLPLDTRHITFAAANLGLSLQGLDWQVDAGTIALSAVGVGAVGMVNLVVSFSLALYVAMKSQRVSFVETPALVGNLLQRFLSRPMSFFLPPPDVPADAA